MEFFVLLLPMIFISLLDDTIVYSFVC